MRALPLLLLVVLGCAARPAVVVTLVIDQQAAWTADQRWPLLPETGGFARLRREGTWVRRMTFEHAVTLTAPGHAALYTGRPPRESGIFANDVPDAQGRHVSFLRDPATHLIGGDPAGVGSSTARLRVPTLADRLQEADPGAVVVSVSLKDRAAIFGGGRHPRVVLWLDTVSGKFVTSDAFATAVPAWVSAPAFAPWEVSDAAWITAHALTPDAQAGEGDYHGFGVTFPHDPHRLEAPGRAWRATPGSDEALLALATSALDHEHPRLLAVSLSANDYILHFFGPDSWEAWDELLRLDRALASFLDGLDRRYGPDGWAMLVSGDHGGSQLPEAAGAVRPWCAAGTVDFYERPCGPLRRVISDDLERELDAAAVAAVGPGHWVLSVTDPYIYFTDEAKRPENWPRVVAAVTRALVARPEIAAVRDGGGIPATCPPPDNLDGLICRSMPPGMEQTLFVTVRPGVFVDTDYISGSGTSHGSPYLYDRAVPLLVRAPGRFAAGVQITETRPYTMFAETAASLLGIPWR